MADDDDLRGLMPDAPPPDPVRRDTAIEAALRRFDTQAKDPSGAGSGIGERRAGRMPVAVLASLGLVAVLTVSVLLSNDRRFSLDREPDLRPGRDASGEAVQRTTAIDIALPPAMEAAPARQAADAAPAVQGIASTVPATQADMPTARFASPATAGAASQAIAVAPPPPPAPAAPSALAANEAVADSDSEGGRSIVVTGARRSNARQRADVSREVRSSLLSCTVLDPRPSVRRCAGLADAAKSGDSSEAGARLVEGLTRAWRGDDRGALRAFDRAIASDPEVAAAYLNRGLVRRESGQTAAAMADFTRAIEADPDDARGYYFRSLLLRRTGEAGRADEDLARVREIAGN